MRYKEYVAKCLAPRSCNDRVAIKIYIEQLLTKDERFNEDGSVREITEERKKEVLKAFKARLKAIPKNEWQIIAIVHDKDPASGGWSAGYDKPHIHVIIRCIARDKGGDIQRPRVNTYLNRLGIYYQISDDNPVDLELWKNHGVEYCWHFGEYAIYLLHKSDKAKAQGKEPYEIEEFFGNLTEDEIREVMKGYTQVGESLGKVTDKTLAELDETAYKLGCELGDYDEWYDTLPFNVRSNAKMRTVKESYERGINKRLDEKKTVSRLCVYIQSPQNMGKTHAAAKALEQLGVRYHPVGGGGTGKFDELKVTHDAIIVDDDACPNLLNMADMRFCRAYKRNKNNPPWVGHYLIVTSNLSFEEWVEEKCGIKNKENIKAVRSRFYICHLEDVKGNNVLVCTSPSSRGSADVKREVLEMYKAFRKYYDESLAGYHPSDDDVDYSELNGDAYNEARREEREAAEKAEEEKKRAAEERKKREEEYVRDPAGYVRKLQEKLRVKGKSKTEDVYPLFIPD